ncbi:unnamed protein product [Pleuronectes platessa]|uniref:Uncharacterized protein n=1 Tax=Pleuronectes platessa TaxID=8262 RepID=A0A9N7VWT7_PLEPL|nr:unnamed protein product [Pleuronectes platessa]
MSGGHGPVSCSSPEYGAQRGHTELLHGTQLVKVCFSESDPQISTSETRGRLQDMRDTSNSSVGKGKWMQQEQEQEEEAEEEAEEEEEVEVEVKVKVEVEVKVKVEVEVEVKVKVEVEVKVEVMNTVSRYLAWIVIL